MLVTPKVGSNENSEMDRLMKEMKTFNDQRESEIKSYKLKCKEMETVLSSIKKSIQMDKLQTDFDSYKLETARKIENLENSKTLLKIKVDSLTRELNAEKDRWKITEANLKKKVTDLTHTLNKEKANSMIKIRNLTTELNTEKAIGKSTEQTVKPLSVEVQKTNTEKILGTLSTPDEMETVTTKNEKDRSAAGAVETAASKNENEIKSLLKIPAVVIDVSSTKSNQDVEKDEILSAPVISAWKNRAGRKRKSII